MAASQGGKPNGGPAASPRRDPADEEAQRRAFYRAKRGKNLAVLAALVGFALLVYLVSIVRMSG
ncbi:hypothetical protein SAMN06265365_101704 [Tistlia consotensis]|uniref:Uncharacterized protein n=1 Tax=Tistlia consotensis USBA 355 TaxID=560819 RepID=A0A1Y6BBF7_9PROT|nr:hypothetical protein [Tistlia consotensis]SME94695.1 hypothetical protein SAMN05428998_101703 [Tistlia consotensis USBA 355]SNR29493.1 hypothetical protein SAMN06265365_101704 [Tistlia consotensis]